MSDKLVEIEKRWSDEKWTDDLPWLATEDVVWLVAKVKQLREKSADDHLETLEMLDRMEQK